MLYSKSTTNRISGVWALTASFQDNKHKAVPEVQNVKLFWILLQQQMTEVAAATTGTLKTCKAPVISLLSTYQYTQLYRPGCLSRSPTNSVGALSEFEQTESSTRTHAGSSRVDDEAHVLSEHSTVETCTGDRHLAGVVTACHVHLERRAGDLIARPRYAQQVRAYRTDTLHTINGCSGIDLS